MKLAKHLNSAVVALLNIYQRIISPFFGNCCRFYPSCSQYAKESFKKAPFYLAMFYTSKRLLKCHPFCVGGIDELKV